MNDREKYSEYEEVVYSPPLHTKFVYGVAMPVFERTEIPWYGPQSWQL